MPAESICVTTDNDIHEAFDRGARMPATTIVVHVFTEARVAKAFAAGFYEADDTD